MGSREHGAERPLDHSLRTGLFRPRSLAGQRLGPFVVERLIAQGGMGAVFRARHTDTGEPVALKILLPEARQSEVRRRRFRREAELLAALDHPGIVRVLAHGEADGVDWLAMEFVEGPTLQLDERGLRSVVRAVAQVAEALSVAHARGIVHRDLKPANILIRPDGRPAVTDFGVARDLGLSSSLTKTGTGVGTPLYMAPEQVRGEETSPATDVHALGVILYEGLTGSLPWGAEHDNVVAATAAILSSRPPPPSKLRPGIPPALDAICLRCLAKDPRRRYADAGELCAALSDFLAGGLRAPHPARRGLWIGAGASLLAPAALLAGFAFWGDGTAGSGDPVAHKEPPRVRGTEDPPPARPDAPRGGAPPPAVRELVLSPGPVRGQDTTVRGDGLYLNDNFGSQPYMLVGLRNSKGQRGPLRSLLRFDLSRLPQGARLHTAELRVYLVGRHPRGPWSLPLRLYALGPSPQGGPWQEGTSGLDLTLDGVCWDGDAEKLPFPQGRSRRPEYTQPGLAAVDFGLGAPALASEATLSSEATSCAFDVTALVGWWLEQPQRNYGLRLAAAREEPPYAERYASLATSDFRNPNRWPTLVLRYAGPPPAPERPLSEVLNEARRKVRPVFQALRKALDGAPTARRGAEALGSLQEAVETAPFLGEGYYLRGWIYALLGDAVSALGNLRSAETVLEPYRKPELYLLRAQVFLAQGDVEGCRRDLETAAGLAPGDPRLEALREQLEGLQSRGR
ncbi:MAG: serine/threonine protein kinase [Planctomycetota bacterium]|nr:MAG: serine/threonine protein kinase [Planctomycetota bacterium]